MHRVRRTLLQRAAIVAACLIAAAADTRAESNPQPIAIPAIGTQGAATPYPSRIVVNSLGGPNHTGEVSVTLHGVTHPCVDELAVLLVHNESAKYLLLSNAGGCRALAGTDLRIADTAGVLGNGGPLGPPYGVSLGIDASNYGAQPVFPAPAPAGPYTAGRPPNTVNVNGTWDLYIVDTTNNNRGVVAAGWSLNYSPALQAPPEHTAVGVPGAGTSGPAQSYPLEFDFTTVSPAALVNDVSVTLFFDHERPDDLRIVLQSPEGTSVVLMVNAGGNTAVPTGTRIVFRDLAGGTVPNGGPIVNNTIYRPGGQYIGMIGQPVPAPGPSAPYETAFSAMAGEQIAGTWKLWVSDGVAGSTGTIDNVELRITPQAATNVTIVNPTGVGPIPSTQPFVRVEVSTTGVLDTGNAMFRVTNGPALEFYDAGPMTRIPNTGIYVANVPVKAGINDIMVRFRATSGAVHTEGLQIRVDEFQYTLAEGATGTFFDLDVTVANPNAMLAGIRMDFLHPDIAISPVETAIAAHTPYQVHVDEVTPEASLSTVVRSLAGLPLAIERTMMWDANGYGGHGATAASPAYRWLFAEGSQGYFNTYILLANSGATDSVVTMNFLLEGGGIVTHGLTVPAGRRRTVYAGEIDGLVNQSFGVDIVATQPINAERAMYLPGARLPDLQPARESESGRGGSGGAIPEGVDGRSP
jgi:hypothetical protein